MEIKLVIERVQTRFTVLTEEQSGETVLLVRNEDLLPIITFLKNDPILKFDCLQDITATDERPLNGNFIINYQLLSLEHRLSIWLKTRLKEQELVLQSITSLWPGAELQEREIWDLLGIRFTGLTNHSRLYLPEDVSGHPLRKDFPLLAAEMEINGFRG